MKSLIGISGDGITWKSDCGTKIWFGIGIRYLKWPDIMDCLRGGRSDLGRLRIFQRFEMQNGVHSSSTNDVSPSVRILVVARD